MKVAFNQTNEKVVYIFTFYGAMLLSLEIIHTFSKNVMEVTFSNYTLHAIQCEHKDHNFQ